MPGKFQYAPGVLAAIASHAEKSYPDECCGALVGFAPDRVEEAIPLQNLAAKSRPKDPDGRERSARDAYEVDPRELDRVYDEAEKKGQVVLGIYHSHVEVGAYFSRMDREVALAFGDEPTYPLYVVASVRAQRCDAIKSFHWEGGDFRETDLPWPA